MKRRSLIFRGLCALFGLTAARIQAESAVEVAQAVCKPPQMLKWTVWFKGDHQMHVEAATVRREIIKGVTFDGAPYDLSALLFEDGKGEVVGQAFLENVKAYGCAYPPQKVGKDWLCKHVTVHAPPHQSLA